MCTLFVLINQIRNIPLAIISNRDEYYERNSSEIQLWDESFSQFGNSIIAPRDEAQKGTWFACENKLSGKWAILTNIRDPSLYNKLLKSRGEIILNFLNYKGLTKNFINELCEISNQYNSFNLIYGDAQDIFYFHSLKKISQHIFSFNKNGVRNNTPLIVGLSNGELDANWPKIINTKNKFLNYFSKFKSDNVYSCFEYLTNEMQSKKKYSIEKLPKTGVSGELEIFLSSLFIVGEKYGTCSTLFFALCENENKIFYEHTYNNKGKQLSSKNITINLYE